MASSEPGTALEAASEGGPPDYWQAVIAALSPPKRDAAWRFYEERDLGRAHEARDTFSGLLLLLEANGLFMERCARRLQEGASGPRDPRPADPAAAAEVVSSLRAMAGQLEALERRFGAEGLGRTAGPPRARLPLAWGVALGLCLTALAGVGAWAWAKHEGRQARRAYRAGAQAVEALRAQGGALRTYGSTDPSTGAPTWVLEVRSGPRQVLHAGVNAEGAAVVSLTR